MPLTKEQKLTIFGTMTDAQKELLSESYGELKEALAMQGAILNELRDVSIRLNRGARALAIGAHRDKVGQILTGEYDFQRDPELLHFLEQFEKD